MRTNQQSRQPIVRISTLVTLAVIVLLGCSQHALGQWTNGTDISNTNSGNVGIGTTTPTYKLDILSSSNILARFRSSAAANNQVLFDAPAGYNANLTLQQAGISQWYLGNRAANNRFSFIESTGMLEVFSILQNGNVGIGTISPGKRLEVLATDGEAVRLYRNGNSVGWGVNMKFAFNNSSNVQVDYAGVHGLLSANTAGAEQGGLLFTTVTSGSLTEKMRIDASGNVGIGTASPAGPLDVRLSPGNAYAGLLVNYSANNGTYLRAGSASAGDIHLGDLFTRNVLLGEAGGVKIGVGTNAPTTSLDVAGQIRSSTGGFKFPDGTVQTTAASGGGGGTITGVTAGAGLTGGGTSGSVTLNNDDRGSTQYIFKNLANGAGTSQFSAGSNNDTIRFAGSGGTSVTFDAGTKKVTVDSSAITSSQWATSGSTINYASGNVGIGVPNPTVALDVTGDIKVSGNINAKYQDVAEWVPATQALPAGTVVVLNPNQSNQVMASAKAYDTHVAGVISERPGIALGEAGKDKVLVATTGRVRVRVDASRAPIHIGDLLVASDKEGMAMKSEPINVGGVEIHRAGTLIGKALEPLEKGSGEILVLLSLQ
jgi:hypothetical protein